MPSPSTERPLPPVHRRLTARGWCLLALSPALFLMAVHFSNNILFLMCFCLLSLIIVAIIGQWTALSTARVHLAPPGLAEAGAQVRILFTFAAGRGGAGLRVDTALGPALPDGQGALVLSVPALVRGRHALGPGRLVAADPFGLFEARRALDERECPAQAALLAYPRPDWDAPAPATPGRTEHATGPVRGMLSGLRPYRPGDSPGDVSWRHSARGQGLVVKEYDTRARSGIRHYDWAAVADRGIEPALSALSASILTSMREGGTVSLDLPGAEIGPGQGPGHLSDLLRALGSFKPG